MATLLLLRVLTFDHARLSAVISTALGVALILTALALIYRDRGLSGGACEVCMGEDTAEYQP